MCGCSVLSSALTRNAQVTQCDPTRQVTSPASAQGTGRSDLIIKVAARSDVTPRSSGEN